MLACTRIGAMHSIVFAGFSSEAWALGVGRIIDLEPSGNSDTINMTLEASLLMSQEHLQQQQQHLQQQKQFLPLHLFLTPLLPCNALSQCVSTVFLPPEFWL